MCKGNLSFEVFCALPAGQIGIDMADFRIFGLSKTVCMKRILLRRRVLLFALSGLLLMTSCTSFLATVASTALSAKTFTEFKESLIAHYTDAVKNLAKPGAFSSAGLVKILLPPEAQFVMNYIHLIPGAQQTVDGLVTKMNQAAESAVEASLPIVTQVIRPLTQRQVIDIINAGPSGATDYIKNHARNQLKASLVPKIKETLEAKVPGARSAFEIYDSFSTLAGTVAAGKTLPDLPDYVAGKAVDGLLKKMAEEEAVLREDMDLTNGLQGLIKAGMSDL